MAAASRERGTALTAEEVKDALRAHHPAIAVGGAFVGRWTCLEEFASIDLLAVDAWSSASVVGYEVKISRSDLRSELLNPTKRAVAIALTTHFYIAVPKGLLTPEEIAWREPEWKPEDFKRGPCTNQQCSARHKRRGWGRDQPKPRGSTLRGTSDEGVSVRLGYDTEQGVHPKGGTYSHTFAITACCAICKGYGTVGKSRVEEIAPTLWVPRDVGLVEIDGRGVHEVKRSPVRKETKGLLDLDPRRRGSMDPATLNRMNRVLVASLIRWVSARPDPRHIRLVK